MKINIILLSCLFCGFITLPALALSNSNGTKTIKTAILSAQDAASSSFFDTIPPAKVECIFGGSLAKIFTGRVKFESSDNAILIDGDNRKLAVREKILTEPDENKGQGAVDMYIQVSNVSNNDIISLLVLKRTVRTQNAKVNLFLKKTTDKGDITFSTSFGDNKKLVPAIMFAKVRKIGSTKFNDTDYFLVSGAMKLRISEPLHQVNTGNTSLEGETPQQGDEAGIMKCIFENCPVVETNLEKLREAFGINITEEDILDKSLDLKSN